MADNNQVSDTRAAEGGETAAPVRTRMPFGRANFLMMAGCLVLIVVGFALMSGGGSAEDTAFDPEIFSTRRIVVGPALTFLGFLLMAFAIIWTPGKNKKQ